MELTEPLLLWLREEFKKSDIKSIRGLSRESDNLSYQGWNDILAGRRDTIGVKPLKDICKVFHTTEEELLKISKSKVVKGKICYQSTEEFHAMALWRWLKYDKKRSEVLSMLGYTGCLPESNDPEK